MTDQFHPSVIPRSLLPTDHSWQSSAIKLAGELFQRGFTPARILDLGCGIGQSRETLFRLFPRAFWTGIDIPVSPEISTRSVKVSDLCSFNGIWLPFETESFELIYSRQVLEHVRQPFELIHEVGRVLKVGGFFAGSVSQLEPYHSFSVFNWTPYSLDQIFKSADLHLTQLRPGVDGITLIIRSIWRPSFSNNYFEKESPINMLFTLLGRLLNKPVSSINAVKLRTAGHLCFLAQKQ